MRKIFFLAILLALCNSVLLAQYNIQPVLPSTGLIQKSQLWNVLLINNSKNNTTCKLEMVLLNRASGSEELTATSTQIDLQPGAKQMNAVALTPIQYNYINTEIAKSNEDFLPIGNYNICYKLVTITAEPVTIAEECVSFDVEPLSPPLLTVPSDGAELTSPPSQFTWIPPSPINLFKRLAYEVVFVEVYGEQKPQEAIQQNTPFYTEQYIRNNTLTYKALNNNFQKDKIYAWQIVARDDKDYATKSEVWTFVIRESSRIEKIIKGTPFVKMKLNEPDMAIAPNGILKMNYSNRCNDSIVEITVFQKDKNQFGMARTSKKIRVQAGENNLNIDLKKDLGLKNINEQNLYSVELINSKKENWVLNFQVKNF